MKEATYLRRDKAIRASPTIITGGTAHIVPRFATRFKFKIANTAAATRNTNPSTCRVLADKFLPPLLMTVESLREQATAYLRPKY